MTSRRHHILKKRLMSSLISYGWILGILIVLLVFINFTKLNLSALGFGFLVSLTRTSVAYAIALALALVFALLVSINTVAENLFLPLFDVLQSFPSFAIFPILVSVLKNSPESVIIAVLALSMIWPILFAVIGGIKNRREDLEEAATIFGARGLKRLWYFSIPELWSSILTGSIVGWGEGWEFIIGAELLVKTNFGIGTYLGFLGNNGKFTLLMFGIAILMLLLFVINKLIWLPLLEKATKYGSEN